ncbi:hypothetical protein OG21DRAFT_1010664 [Imleria badia]|nr:hypothetical protein OG21DRAFT_1010664 [Imleria badia]
MATSNATLPPIGKISMIGIWIETVLYGVNCVMYGLCMFILLRGGKVATLRWVLLVMCTILFLLCTVHVGASVRQLLEAFVYAPADVPDYSTTYWLDYTTMLSLLKNNLYASLVLVQDFILIWRLYVVFMIIRGELVTETASQIILAAGCVGSAYAASAISALPNDGLYGSVTSSVIIASWAFGFTLNVSVTGVIVARLWRMGRTMVSLTATSNNRFASTIYGFVESGAIFSVTNIVVLALYASNSPVAVTGLDVASQLAVWVHVVLLFSRTGSSRFVSADIDATLDRRTGWAD